MTRLAKPITALAAALLMGAARCNNPFSGGRDPIVCTEEARPAISLTVSDSLTGTAAGLTGLWARAVDGSHRDSTTFFFAGSTAGTVNMSLAYERAGTYAVTVHANGYLDWNKAGVVVSADECHVTTVQLTARLVK